MSIVAYFALFIVMGYIVIQVVVLLAFFTHRDEDKPVADNNLPFVSILIAARNEQAHILRCLQSIEQLNYPADKFEVWVGNDRSEDQTEQLVRGFIQNKPYFKLINIESEWGQAKGKANVLAQLARQAKGDYLLITDADIAVQPDWIKSLLGQTDEKTAIVSGITIVEPGTWLETMQHTDWLYFMALMQGFVYLGIPATAVGNNMLVLRKAYDETGGYEHIPFSVTEDFKLFQRVRQLGWQTKNVALPQCVNYSKGVNSLKKLLWQRKRWLAGGKELPMFWWVVFSIFGLFWPAIIVLAWYNGPLALGLYFVKWGLQWLYIVLFSHRLHLRSVAYRFLSYELYSLFITIASAIYFLLPLPVSWKGRHYKA